MSGRLTINKITDCKGLTIKMDDAKIIGDYTSLEINDISHSTGTKISMKNTQVMTHEEYQRSLNKGSGTSGYGSGGYSAASGSLTVNKVTDCDDTDIDQENMKISGRFDDVTFNQIERSTNTKVNMAKISVNTGYDDSDSTDDDDEDEDSYGRGSSKPMKRVDDEDSKRKKDKYYDVPDDERDADGLPLPSTYAYHIADKFTFNIRLGGGANVTCTFLQENTVKTIKNFIIELQPHFKNKSYRLQVVNSEPPVYVDNDVNKTLKDAGFREKMDLRTVINSPEGDDGRCN